MSQAAEMAKNITRLEKKIAEKEGFIALAHTRLGNRCQRSGLEQTRDKVEKSLANEVSDLREVVIQLQQALFEVCTLNILYLCLNIKLILKYKYYIYLNKINLQIMQFIMA